MKRLAACLALLALAGTAQAQQRDRPDAPRGRSYANPSAVITAEMAFARLALEKGQWAAFRATAAPDAVMFTPTMVLAQTWLRNRPDPPPPPLTWRAYQVWSSCDGSLMVTSGGWRHGGKHGRFTAVWQRQEKGGYKWLLRHGAETGEPIAEPDMISARVAECPPRRAGERRTAVPGGKRSKPIKHEVAPPPPFDPARREGRSNDGSLAWEVTVEPGGARRFVARMQTDGRMQPIRDEAIAAPAP